MHRYFIFLVIFFHFSDPTTSSEFMSHLEKIHIPVWLLVSGCAVFFVPGIYFIYDKYCKDEHGGPWIKSAANCIVIFYLLCGLSWSVVGKFIHSGYIENMQNSAKNSWKWYCTNALFSYPLWNLIFMNTFFTLLCNVWTRNIFFYGMKNSYRVLKIHTRQQDSWDFPLLKIEKKIKVKKEFHFGK